MSENARTFSSRGQETSIELKPLRPLRVLMLEDCAMDAGLAIQELRRSGFDPEWKRVETEEEFRANLDPGLQVILSDNRLPTFDGLAALRVVKEQSMEVPLIVVSGAMTEETAAELIRAGAFDCLHKDCLARLGHAVAQALEARGLRDGLRKAEAELELLRAERELILESSADGIHGLDREGRIVFENAEGAAKLGWEAADLIGRSAHEVIHHSWPDGRPMAVEDCAVHATLKDGRIRESNKETFWRKDGTSIPVEYRCAPMRDSAGEIAGAVVTFRDIRERLQSESELRESEARFRAISEASPLGIFVTDASGDFIYTNMTARQISGLGFQEIVGKGWMSAIHPDDREQVGMLWTMAIESGDRFESIHRLRKPQDQTVWVSMKAAPMRGESKAMGYVGVLEDISMRKETEDQRARLAAEIERQRWRLDNLIADTPGIVWENYFKPDPVAQRTSFVSDYAEKMLGFPVQEWEQTPRFWLTRVHPADRERVEREAEEVLASGEDQTTQFRWITRDGRVLWVEARTSAIHDGSGRPIGLRGITLDITDRMESEERIREQARLLDLAQDAIIVREFEGGRIVFWNKGAERLYGWTREEALGQNIAELLHHDVSALEEVAEQVLSIGEWRGERHQFTKTGERVSVSARATLVRDDENRPEAVLNINTDITEQKKLEAQFLRAQRLESIGTLASGVAHDLNNILTPILMCAPLLRSDLDAKGRETILSTIEASAQRGADIVKQVLTFARGIEGERIRLAPQHLIKEILKIARETFPKSISLKDCYPDDLWAFEGDATQLHQVLLNLCVNARDAMPQGGQLTVSAENFVLDEHYAQMMPDGNPGNYVIIRVSDTGTGIPKEILDQIFDPFFTTKEAGKGTGLGLSTVIGIIKSHRGFVSVYSEPGMGTTFKVFIPAASGAALATEKTAGDLPRGNGELVLVVDDEEGILTVTQAMLERHGYNVITTMDGTEALAAFARRMEEIQLVLTDIMMPYMDGITLIRALRKIKADVKVIASTGQAEDSRMAELKTLNVPVCLTKPYNTARLLAAVSGVLSGSDLTRAG